jgi:hypothetical protein
MNQFDFIVRFLKRLVLILMLSISANAYSQDISGSYRWILDDGRRYFEISLSSKNAILGTIPTSFQGEHCGVFEDGRRMDCSYEEYSIALNKVSENVFTGTILSAYSRTLSEIKVTYFPDTKKIRWQVTKQGEGQTYLPKDVIMD